MAAFGQIRRPVVYLADIGINSMQEIQWPDGYAEAINKAVNLALTAPLREAFSEIESVGISFAKEMVSGDSRERLSGSMLRNKLLAATLSKDDQVSTVLGELIRDMSASGLFNADEMKFHEGVVAGKIKSL